MKKGGKVYLLSCQFLTEILAASLNPNYHSLITSLLICLMPGMVSKTLLFPDMNILCTFETAVIQNIFFMAPK